MYGSALSAPAHQGIAKRRRLPSEKDGAPGHFERRGFVATDLRAALT